MAGRQNLGPEQLAETCYAGLKEMLDKKRDFGLLGLMRASGMHVAQLMTFSKAVIRSISKIRSHEDIADRKKKSGSSPGKFYKR